jgi:hypothetical protein
MPFALRVLLPSLRVMLLLGLLCASSHAAPTRSIQVSDADLQAADELIAVTAGFVESGQILASPGADGDPAIVMNAFPRRAEQLREQLAHIVELAPKDDWDSRSQLYSEAFLLLRTAYLLRGSLPRVAGAEGTCKGTAMDELILCPIVDEAAAPVLVAKLEPLVAVARSVAQGSRLLQVPDEQLSLSGALRQATAVFELALHPGTRGPRALELSPEAIESLRAQLYDLELRESHMRFAMEMAAPLDATIAAVRAQADLDEMDRAQILVYLEFARSQIQFSMDWSQC